MLVPIIPEYLYHLEHKPTSPFKFFAKNCTSFNDKQYRHEYYEQYQQALRKYLFSINCSHLIDWIRNAQDIESAQKQEALVKENGRVGFLLASKPMAELLANGFVGPLTNSNSGVILSVSQIVLAFAFVRTYILMLLARSVQGIGSACTTVAGLGILAQKYPDNKERGKIMSIAVIGIGFGAVAGPPFGGFMDDFVGGASPFLVVAGLVLLDGLLQLTVLEPRITKQAVQRKSVIKLLRDPYIILAAGTTTCAYLTIGTLEGTLPIHMITTMNSSATQAGLAFLPLSLSYLISASVPFATNIYGLILPLTVGGLSAGMAQAVTLPTMAYLIDIRHSSAYGNVYAISGSASCLAFIVGPSVSGILVQAVGFR
ncbi:unnamed protein product [Didymodactylos carnosus]|uniref:Major facilitator superfamily (MFS) profile domain-containing protein n=1 Tax=Didymodactylos carnosus TaxID=1234261 RepID=A0A815L988_9BILA|nr:unnamed protein product [Didymodactylos carnosus]CAF4296105.1 unnamed protein product [Didymodactylos carnosus]